MLYQTCCAASGGPCVCGNAKVKARPSINSTDPADFESPDLHEGFDTVGHWWATKEPEALEMLSDPLSTFYSDSEALQTICEERNLPFRWVRSGPAFLSVGLAEVRAYPVELLATYYPSNP